jgi:hypothetical protein
MTFWRNVSPAGAISDFRTVFKEAGPNRWRFAALAAATTVGVFSVMSGESWKKPRPLPEITYITAWPEHRTDAETRAFIAENQRRKDAREALLQEQEKVGQDMYMALGRATGVDVDRMKAKADAERAAEQAAAKAKAEALIEGAGKAPVGR